MISKYSPLSSKVKEISLGREHCVALSENGTAYAWGSNSHGQLGFESSSDTFIRLP